MLKMYIIVVLLFSLVAPVIWCTVIYMIGFTSGWQSLAKTYAVDRFPTNPKSCSGVLNFASNYNETLQYAETVDGLFLKTSALFKIGHHPLFIPWTAIKNYQQGSALVAKYVSTFEVNGIRIKLYTDSNLSK